MNWEKELKPPTQQMLWKKQPNVSHTTCDADGLVAASDMKLGNSWLNA